MRHALWTLAAIAALASVACQDTQQAPIAGGPTVADSADQVLFNAHFLLTNHGIQRGNLTADTAYILDETTRIDLRKAHVVFTTETGAPQGTMEANRGVYSTRTQVLEGWGNVIVKLVDGRTLHSPHVTFSQLTHQISSDTTYTISGKQGTQMGIGFTTNQTFRPFKCLRNCGGDFSVILPEK
jgi:LPS export ABC transporter protein LptC